MFLRGVNIFKCSVNLIYFKCHHRRRCQSHREDEVDVRLNQNFTSAFWLLFYTNH